MADVIESNVSDFSELFERQYKYKFRELCCEKYEKSAYNEPIKSIK